MCELVINVGKPYERTTIEGKEKVIVKGSHFTGIKSLYCFIRPNSGMKKMSIRFKPGAISLFTRMSAYEHSDRVIDARELFGKEIKELEDAVEGFKDDKELIKKTESFLLKKLYQNAQTREIVELARIIYMHPSTCRIEDIKGNFSNYKQLERKFSKFIGMMPKQFIKIAKFNYSTKIKYANPNLPLTKIGYLAGYSDQSHFIRNFKQLSGQTPKEYYPDLPLVNWNQRAINNLFDATKPVHV